MKRIILSVIYFFISISIFCAEIELYTGYMVIDYGTRRSIIEYRIYFDTTEECISLKYFDDTIYISKNDVSNFRIILEKYLEWRSIAVANNVTISREIPNSAINITRRSRSIMNNRYEITNHTISFSIETNNVINGYYVGYQYLLPGNNYLLKMSMSRHYSSYHFYSVQEILNSISISNIANLENLAREEEERQREIDDLFR